MRAKILYDAAPPGGGGGAPPDWRTTLPPEYQADPALKDVPDVTTLAKNYLNTKSLVGRSVVLPNEKSTPEERSAFFDKLGRPKEFAGYESPKDLKLHPELKIDATQLDGFRKSFHELGLSKPQGEALIKQYLETMNGNVTAMETAREQETAARMAELDKEWGVNKDANLKIVARAVDAFGGAELRKFFDESGLGNHPAMIKMFYDIGKKIGEDRSNAGDSQFKHLDASAAQAEIEKLKNDPTFQQVFLDPKHKDYAETVKKWQDLHRVAYPGQTVEA